MKPVRDPGPTFPALGLQEIKQVEHPFLLGHREVGQPLQPNDIASEASQFLGSLQTRLAPAECLALIRSKPNCAERRFFDHAIRMAAEVRYA